MKQGLLFLFITISAAGALANSELIQGKLLIDQGKFNESIPLLQKALGEQKDKSAYINFLLGQAFKGIGQDQQALQRFALAVEGQPPRNIVYQARFEISELASRMGRPEKAQAHLKYLERRWRGTNQHPEVVWRLIGTELKLGRRWQACRWARKMYAYFPGHPLADNWTVDLPESEYDGKALGCLASPKDLKTRIKRLQLSGYADRARREIDVLLSRAQGSSKYDVDVMLADFLEFRGFPDEGIKVLTVHYREKMHDYNYLSLLGKVSSRAGEFPTAIGAYYRAYQKSPRTTNGRRALFSAAFLSYQSRDYDGANRKFQELDRRFPGSGLSKDARWHMAWIRYLKKDFVGADADFSRLITETHHRRRRRIQPFNDDRTKYWLAMTKIRLGRPAEAEPYFRSLTANKNLSFYSVLAQERLKQISSAQGLRSLAADPSLLTVTGIDELTQLPQTGVDSPASQESAEAEESEDTLSAAAAEVAEKPDEETPIESPEEAAEEAKDEAVIVSSFRDPLLQQRFDRASEFIKMGFTDWAKWELYEIERRTSNKLYLRNLMEAYEKIGSYNRSVYISEIFFSGERARGGFKGAKDLWAWNFPRAYESLVVKNSQDFGVMPEITWSIMRAESQFFSEALSPVGARGLMQIMPYTAAQIGRLLSDKNYHHDRFIEPEMNIRYGVRYLSRLQKQFDGSLPLVAAAYNAGPHRVFSWLNNFGTLDMDEFIEHVPFVETRNYIKKVVRHFVVYRGLYDSAAKDNFQWLTQPISLRVAQRPSPREVWGTLD